MARVMIEDCEKVVANRFDLVVFAAQRARQIIGGDVITLKNREGKKPVVALREIAAKSVSIEGLEESTISEFRTFPSLKDMEENIEDFTKEDTYNPYGSIESLVPNPADNSTNQD
jgi:DNA-directed RNA polymerase subunit omega